VTSPRSLVVAVVVGGLVHGAAPVAAEPLVSGVGVAITVGGGVEEPASGVLRSAVGPAALWEVRAAIATRLPISTELAYLGTASTIERDGDPAGMLVSSGVEVALRANLSTSSRWRPYLLVGRALRYYRVSGAAHTKRSPPSRGADRDVTLDLPIGAGCMIHLGGLVLDVRGVFRAAIGSELVVADPAPGQAATYAESHSWSASARVGYEF
jgi:hypothetical protein